MPKAVRDVLKGLEKKGFRRRDNDHTFLHLLIDGRKTPVFTKVSHGEKQLGDNLLAVMARQLRINGRQFRELIDCPLSQDEYVQLLREGGHIE